MKENLTSTSENMLKKYIRLPFTIIELLVVISIISILASLLLPALRKAKESAHRTVCAGGMKQLGIGLRNYVTDSDSWWPYREATGFTPLRFWALQLTEGDYMNQGESPEDFSVRCPSRKRNSGNAYLKCTSDYIINAVASDGGWFNMGGGLREGNFNMRGCKDMAIGAPSTFGILGEKDDEYVGSHHYVTDFRYLCTNAIAPTTTGCAMSLDSHDQSSNYICADGHTENISWRNFKWGLFTIRKISSYKDKTILNR